VNRMKGEDGLARARPAEFRPGFLNWAVDEIDRLQGKAAAEDAPDARRDLQNRADALLAVARAYGEWLQRAADLAAESRRGVTARAGGLSRILLTTDGSEGARQAERLLALLPLAPEACVRLLVVADASDWTMPEWFKEIQRTWGERTVEEAASRLHEAGIAPAQELRSGDAAREIVEAAKEAAAELVLLGGDGESGHAGFPIGRVARNVARHAPCPVIVARSAPDALRRILLAVDESEHSRRCVELLTRFPLPDGVEIHAVSVVRRYDPFPGLVPDDPTGFRQEVKAERDRRRRSTERLLERAARPLAASGRPATTEVRVGDPATEILAAAMERGSDLIAAGARGVSLIEGLRMGSVADRLLAAAPCSVLIVR
jgi:nucleotide-binding universal stress UspA family protein